MGWVQHDAVIATTNTARPGGLPDIEAFRQSLPEEFRQLVIGPIPSAINAYFSYAFLPDGSKEGWETSDQGDEARKRFVALFDQQYEDGSSQDDVVEVRFGEDYAAEYEKAAVRWKHGAHGGGDLS